MSDIPEKEARDIFFTSLLALGPAIISVLFAIITKPFSEKAKTDALRKNLLETLRFRMAVEVSDCLPEKKPETLKDDYVEMCKTKLNDYFSANSSVIVDFLNSEKMYQSYVRLFKFFKYGIVGIPVLTILCGIISFIFWRDILTLKNCGVTASILILVLFALWGLKEFKRDKYSDLCSKYEVVE